MQLFDRPAVDAEVWDELEELLVSADVGISTTEKLIEKVKKQVVVEKIDQGSHVRAALRAAMVDILIVPIREIMEDLSPPKVILVVGVNGGGKTTSIVKLAHSLKNEGKSVLLVAADTFRAAAIDQLKRLGERAGIEIIAHQSGADPGAVVYDALQAAKSRQVEAVIIDTAGRIHTRSNLMEELEKVKRVAGKADVTAPHEVILVLDATTGQNGLVQARYFTEAIGITGIFLAKLDGTAKGGIVLAICDELKIPIQFIGVGEKLEDMESFNAEAFVAALCD
ncbi:MAG: signal recognition particle-docking protein FtsY [Dehalococcoidales bacterium]|jgi:fused signal recognition particle receptor|nr:signal recognition particle-docking protein FtsY [Dehalococcoidales bacterium]MDP6577275.1 signal recognition particle-docking protein FtsY [Dehalococcoidales bacterium]MDP7415910.1 signal recognition particle-docking protein FtsY [Dehalococcoidales bacterium]|tara:strand:+ start:743 stop:1585 length:843 start_codon:yes stop_codon:yes gene_type:complete